jgi:Protein of unknown function (DUF1822)
MTNNTEEIELAVPLPITRAALNIADRFAVRQPSSKAAQVRLNTLAVCVVDDYLRLMGITTERSASDSWNPILQLSADIADLVVSGVGRLECRPVLPNVQVCRFPPEVWEDRIGYVIVQIDEIQQQANLLGFVPAVSVEELPTSQLQPIESLLNHLDLLRSSTAVNQVITNLSRWAQGIFESGWQTLDSLLSTPAYAFRSAASDSAIQRARLIELEIVRVVLMVELTLASEQTDVLLRIYSAEENQFLPPNVQLLVLDESRTVFLEAQSRQSDDYIQLQFRGTVGEMFTVEVRRGETIVQQAFVI